MIQESQEMLYVVETHKDFEKAVQDLEGAVKRHGFGVMHVHDLKKTLNEKGVSFQNRCRILEVCNPQAASMALNHDMSVNLALPCRISIYEKGGKTLIGMIRPRALLSMFPAGEGLQTLAEEVERATVQMIDEAKA